VALDVTHFEYADRGPTSVYKFRVRDDPRIYVWFEYAGGQGSLHVTPYGGPYRPDHPLEDAEDGDLDALLAKHGTSRTQWVKDLFAQYGERVAWTYP